MIEFIVVLGFNLYWLYKFGKQGYVKMFNGSLAWWFSALCWAYNAYGVAKFIVWILKNV